MNTFAAAAGKDTVKTVVPKEGGFSFCDAYAIPEGADNADTTYAWINEALDPKVNADAAVELVGGVTVRGRAELLDKRRAASTRTRTSTACWSARRSTATRPRSPTSS